MPIAPPLAGASYYADDIDLSQFCWNVESRQASLGTAGRRGANTVIPGADGTFWSRKPIDEKTEVWSMWANGSNADGSMPAGTASRQQVLANIEALMSVFTAGRLIELARVESETVLYGRKNLALNPSFEVFTGKDIARENQWQNPSAEYSSGLAVIRRQYLPNPSFEDGKKIDAFRGNEAINPRFVAEGNVNVQRRNLVPNPSLESELRPWRSNTAVTTTTRSNVKGVFVVWPDTDGGKWSLRQQALTVNGMTSTGGAFPVTAGLTYAVQGRVYLTLNGAGTRTARIRVAWKNRAGTTISTSDTDAAGLTNVTVNTVSGTVTAPALAVSAVVSVRILSATVVGDVVYWDKVMVEQASSVGTYFDGDSDETNGYRYRWSDETGAGPSEAYTVAPYGWRSNPTGRIFALTTEYARYGKTSARIEATATTATRELLLEQTFRGGAQIDPDTVLSASVQFRLYDSVSTTRSLKACVNCYDGDNNLLGVAYNGGTSTPMTDVTVSLVAGEWSIAGIDNVQTRKKTARTTIAIYTGEAWSSGDGGYADGCIMELASAGGDFFDGSTRDDDVFSYEWDDQPHLSTSRQKGYKPTSWTCSGARMYRVLGGRSDDYAVRIAAFRGGSATPYVFATPLDVSGGRAHFLTAYGKPSTGTPNMRVGYSLDGGITYTWGSNAATVTTAWTRASVSVGTLTDAQLANLRVAVQVNGTLADGTYFDVEDVLLEEGAAAGVYFDGDSGRRYAWVDDQYDSVSLAYGKKADSWMPYGAGRPYVEQATGGSGSTYCAQVTSTLSGDFGVTAAQDGIDDDLVYSAGFDVTPPANGTVRVGITYYDKNGAFISETTTDTAVLTGSYTRCAHVGSAPPAGAVAAAPWCVFRTGTAGQVMLVDKAIFGFGSTTTYADGSSGSGWEWKGDIDASESQQVVAAPNYWRGLGGTLVQDSSFSTERTNNGMYTVVSGSAPWRVLPIGDEDRRSEQKRWRLIPGKTATFAIDCRPSANCKVRVGFLPAVWTGFGWKTSTSAAVYATAISLTSGVTTRAFITDIPAPTGDATHFYPVVEVQSAAGGNPSAGLIVRMDSSLFAYDGAGAAYFDGNGTGNRWIDTADLSPSLVVGPARRCFAEVRQPIDMSVINGDLAQFAVEFVIPSGLWEDTVKQNRTYPIGRSGSTLNIDVLAGSTGPINDGVFTVKGPFHDLKITDLATGAWVRIDRHIQDDQSVVIDSGSWTVQDTRGHSLMKDVTHDGSVYLLPMLVGRGETTPRLKFTAKNIGRGATINVVARKRYKQA